MEKYSNLIEVTFLTASWVYLTQRRPKIYVLPRSYEICNNIIIKPVYHGLTKNFRKVFESLKTHHCDVDSARIIASVIHTLFNEKQQQISIEEVLISTEAIVLFFYSCLVRDSGTFFFSRSFED